MQHIIVHSCSSMLDIPDAGAVFYQRDWEGVVHIDFQHSSTLQPCQNTLLAWGASCNLDVAYDCVKHPLPDKGALKVVKLQPFLLQTHRHKHTLPFMPYHQCHPAYIASAATRLPLIAKHLGTLSCHIGRQLCAGSCGCQKSPAAASCAAAAWHAAAIIAIGKSTVLTDAEGCLTI
jgi:hypothetical protein